MKNGQLRIADDGETVTATQITRVATVAAVAALGPIAVVAIALFEIGNVVLRIWQRVVVAGAGHETQPHEVVAR